MCTCRRNLPHKFPLICLNQRLTHNYVETGIVYYAMQSNRSKPKMGSSQSPSNSNIYMVGYRKSNV